MPFFTCAQGSREHIRVGDWLDGDRELAFHVVSDDRPFVYLSEADVRALRNHLTALLDEAPEAPSPQDENPQERAFRRAAALVTELNVPADTLQLARFLYAG